MVIRERFKAFVDILTPYKLLLLIIGVKLISLWRYWSTHYVDQICVEYGSGTLCLPIYHLPHFSIHGYLGIQIQSFFSLETVLIIIVQKLLVFGNIVLGYALIRQYLLGGKKQVYETFYPKKLVLYVALLDLIAVLIGLRYQTNISSHIIPNVFGWVWFNGMLVSLYTLEWKKIDFRREHDEMGLDRDFELVRFDV